SSNRVVSTPEPSESAATATRPGSAGDAPVPSEPDPHAAVEKTSEMARTAVATPRLTWRTAVLLLRLWSTPVDTTGVSPASAPRGSGGLRDGPVDPAQEIAQLLARDLDRVLGVLLAQGLEFLVTALDV